MFLNAFGSRAASKITAGFAKLGWCRQVIKTYYIISESPLIIYIGNRFSNIVEISELLRDREVHFIRNSYHTFERRDRLASLAAEVRAHRLLYPRHRIHFLCPTLNEKAMFEEEGLVPAYFINKNAFVDENQYFIDSAISKEFDAIHNGQMKPYKRHELAAGIELLAVITYRRGAAAGGDEDEYALMVRSVLKHAEWLNWIGNRIPPGEIYQSLNRARVGLCLSAEEGPMAASMEYLLCGLPVVSTRSLGGRDVFFDAINCQYVEDDPDAVAAGVKTMIARAPDANLIRANALAIAYQHRKAFVDLVQSILDEHGAKRKFADEFHGMFSNKMRHAATFPAGFLTHLAKGMPVVKCKQTAKDGTQ